MSPSLLSSRHDIDSPSHRDGSCVGVELAAGPETRGGGGSVAGGASPGSSSYCGGIALSTGSGGEQGTRWLHCHEMSRRLCRHLSGNHCILFTHTHTTHTHNTHNTHHTRCVCGLDRTKQKIDFTGYVELGATLAALSAGIWWLFDRSGPGLALSVIFTMISAAFTHFLLHFSILT